MLAQTPLESTLLSLLLSMAGDNSDAIATHAIERCEVVAQATLKRRERQLKAAAAAAATDGWLGHQRYTRAIIDS